MHAPNPPLRKHRFATATAAIAILLMLGLATPTLAKNAKKVSEAEKANIQVVNDFMDSWSDPDKAVEFLAPDASVRMVEDQPAVVGRAAVSAAFKQFMTEGEVSVLIETLETTVHGPVVMNKRIDTMKTKGKPDQIFPVVGVFVVKNGLITEWTDYLDK